jgi:hypothetical protein
VEERPIQAVLSLDPSVLDGPVRFAIGLARTKFFLQLRAGPATIVNSSRNRARRPILCSAAVVIAFEIIPFQTWPPEVALLVEECGICGGRVAAAHLSDAEYGLPPGKSR